MDEKIIARFWSRVRVGESNECWPWIAGRNHKGYGMFWDGKRTRPATHVALELAGLPRPSGLQALHACDNPSCTNRGHLSWGTGKENVSSGVERGRRKHLVGEAHNRALLTHRQAMQIRQRYINGESGRALALEFNVCKATVAHIACGRNWKHVPLTNAQKTALAKRVVKHGRRKAA